MSEGQQEVTLDVQLLEQVKEVEIAYNQQITELVIAEVGASGCNKQITENVLKECNINAEELLKEGIEINNSNPTLTKQNLAIEIITKIANNSGKYKRMSAIAKEMLKESWWEKNA